MCARKKDEVLNKTKELLERNNITEFIHIIGIMESGPKERNHHMIGGKEMNTGVVNKDDLIELSCGKRAKDTCQIKQNSGLVLEKDKTPIFSIFKNWRTVR